jgi:hypothetical protein
MMAKESKAAKSNDIRWDVYVIELASKVGVFGAVVLSIVTLFIVRGTVAQHREFIDKFFLLKWNKDDYFYQYFIITGLIILFFAQYFYYKQQIKLKNERITELINERNMLQHKLLKKHS